MMKLFEERHGLPLGTVRVVSCHYFQSQRIFTTDHYPVSLCTSKEKLLIATNQHYIEVRDLEHSGKCSHTFPTVDLVQQLTYSEAGNYIACLEMKTSRQSVPIYYVRIYFNWWMNLRDQPMKARIASRVTPNCHPSVASIEMVEIPLIQSAQCICCCQNTGNIAIGIGNTISIYVLSVKAHDISKINFIDFDHAIDIQFSFQLHQLSLCENYVAGGNSKEIQVFKLSIHHEDEMRQRSYTFIGDDDDTIKLKSSSNHDDDAEDDSNEDFDDSKCIHWDFNKALLGKDHDGKLDKDSFPLTVQLKSLSDEDSFVEDGRNGLEICGITFGSIPAHPLKVELDSSFASLNHGTNFQVKIMSLLYKRIPSSTMIGDMETNHLHSMTFVPVYVSDLKSNRDADDESSSETVLTSSHSITNINDQNPFLNPSTKSSLSQLCFFVSTVNEGLLYDFCESNVGLACQYQYTSYCKSAIVDASMVHALTEAGLETYTGRICHCLLNNNLDDDDDDDKSDIQTKIYPMKDDPVCLVDLRPFLNIEYILKSDNRIILLSLSENSTSSSESLNSCETTIYSLQKPPPDVIYKSLMDLADEMKSSSTGTYQHLVLEAGMLLQSQLILAPENYSASHLETIRKLHQQWCFLVACYYLCSKDVGETLLSLPYFEMSKLPIQQILGNVLKNKEMSRMALVRYVKYLLSSSRHRECVSSLPQEVGDSILEFFVEAESEYISPLILSSKLSYKLEKAIQILRRQIADKKNVAEDAVAITYLLQKKGCKESVQSVLGSLPKDKTTEILKNNIHLIFVDEDRNRLSPFGLLLAEYKSDVLSRLLHHICGDATISAKDAISLIKDECGDLSSGVSPILQSFSEYHLSEINDESTASEDVAFVIELLSSIYIENLIARKMETSVSSNTKVQLGKRKAWLNLLPPFKGKVVRKVCASTSKPDRDCPCYACNLYLLKLQSLLCSSLSSDEIKKKVNDKLVPEINGHLSLQLLCATTYNDALRLIRESGHYAVMLQYGIEMFEYDKEKWKVLYNIVLDKRFEAAEESDEYHVLSCIIQGILGRLSEVLEPSDLVHFIPAGMDQSHFIPHLRRSCDKHQANVIKNKIVNMGIELKNMMS